jgi:hypothetical protein
MESRAIMGASPLSANYRGGCATPVKSEGGKRKMPKYVTYLQIVLNPNSHKPGDIASELKKQGWWPVWGTYDFAWPWSAKWTADDSKEYWTKVNKAHTTMKKLNVSCSFRTYEWGKEDTPVYWPKNWKWTKAWSKK